jgi:hypothetical protein
MLSEGIMWVMFIGDSAAYKHNPQHIPDKSCVHTQQLFGTQMVVTVKILSCYFVDLPAITIMG